TGKLYVAVLAGAATMAGSLWGYGKLNQDQPFPGSPPQSSSIFSNTRYSGSTPGQLVDFEKPATKAVPAVVHIKTVMKGRQVSGQGQENPFEQFFGPGAGGEDPRMSQPQMASGSGVTISADGYIVTNNHVVDQASELLVTLNNKKDYKAKVIGVDPSTDLAVIKIEASGLPFLTFANSDDVHLGQWVLAIGYPLNLETTVTSGIVSAKSRSIGINNRNSKTPIESFIQTDAAVNPGNSGGALVNTDGDIIGINSAIASPTGSYAGYSYAIPSNLVKKVASDIMKYGSSKRAYLGVMFGSDQMSEEDRKKNNMKEGDGVYVMDVSKGSAAEEAGVQKGDFITKINDRLVNTGTEMVERISSLHPGDKISITYQRNGSTKTSQATLKGSTGTYAMAKEQVIEQLGASFESLEPAEAAKLQLKSGVVVKQLSAGILTEQTRIKEGFIITKVNNKTVGTADELKDAIGKAGNSAIISGIYPNQPGDEYQYALNDLAAN
ncbi:MAG: trypsin-like peptidase domain-containing protein, partial [Chitinophagaceae bacterium]